MSRLTSTWRTPRTASTCGAPWSPPGRGGPPKAGGYRPFGTWEPLTGETEAVPFTRFWAWLTGLRRDAAAAGLVFRAYCYNAAAENTQMRRIAAAAGLADEVDAFIGSGQWVDLLRVFGSQLITGGPAGLKNVAALSGFTWEVEDPGGGKSMLRYDQAVGSCGAGPGESRAAREWLLTYNRNDCRGNPVTAGMARPHRQRLPAGGWPGAVRAGRPRGRPGAGCGWHGVRSAPEKAAQVRTSAARRGICDRG